MRGGDKSVVVAMSVSAENSRMRRLRRERFSLLNDWYGGDFASVEIAAHNSRPRPLKNGVRAVMAALETPEERTLRTLRDSWPEIAGACISRVTVPCGLRAGVLVLEVRHSALLRELKPSLELLLEAVNRHCEVHCTEIRLTVSGGSGSVRPSRPKSAK